MELPLSRKLLSQPKPTVSTMEMHNYMQLWENTCIYIYVYINMVSAMQRDVVQTGWLNVVQVRCIYKR